MCLIDRKGKKIIFTHLMKAYNHLIHFEHKIVCIRGMISFLCKFLANMSLLVDLVYFSWKKGIAVNFVYIHIKKIRGKTKGNILLGFPKIMFLLDGVVKGTHQIFRMYHLKLIRGMSHKEHIH